MGKPAGELSLYDVDDQAPAELPIYEGGFVNQSFDLFLSKLPCRSWAEVGPPASFQELPMAGPLNHLSGISQRRVAMKGNSRNATIHPIVVDTLVACTGHWSGSF